MERRFFLKTLAAGGVAVCAPRLAAGSVRRPNSDAILVVVFQRGAMDGLAAVQPLADDYLKRKRPNLTLAVGKGANGLLDLDGRFGLHPALSPFASHFRDGKLAVVHGVGLPNAVRSHFDAQDFMESGTPHRKGTSTGWVDRLLTAGLAGDSPFRALALDKSMPRACIGGHGALAVEDLRDLAAAPKADLFQELYGNDHDPLLRDAADGGKQARAILAKIDLEARGVAAFPNNPFAQGLQQLAALIRAQAGVRIAYLSADGWDTHRNQGAQQGVFTRTARPFAQSIDAFYKNLGTQRKNVVLLTMTEFGRTVAENGSRGTDHGRGSCFFVLGDRVKGGKVYGDVPLLSDKNLEDGRDLPVTTDYRAVVDGLVRDHLGVKAKSIFPNSNVKPLKLVKS